MLEALLFSFVFGAVPGLASVAFAVVLETMRTARPDPRPHWRRGHVRTLASGTQTWVRPHQVHGSTTGAA
jgi:hypothetical protein